jgi:hypothetical protein
MNNLRHMARWSIIAIFASLALQPTWINAQEATEAVAGYVIQLSANHVQAAPIGFDARVTAQASLPLASPTNLNPMTAILDDTALSPDRQTIASISQTPDNQFTLNVSSVNGRNAISLMLPPTQRPDFSHILRWSPDGLKLAIMPPSGDEPILVYDVLLQQLIPLNVDLALFDSWFPDSSGFFYYGYSVCGEGCRAFGDVYWAVYQNGAFQAAPLTRLDARTLGISNRLAIPIMRYTSPTFYPGTNRIYMALQEAEISPGGVSFLYSTVIGGEPQREADLSAYYPGSQYPTRILRMIPGSRDSLYLLTSTQSVEVTTESAIDRLSLLSYTPQSGLREVYRYDIPRDTRGEGTFSYGMLSPDGRYMAMSTRIFSFSEPGLPESSTLVVIDLAQGTVISLLDNLGPICQPFTWSPDGNQIVYTQSNVERCPLVNPNQPINQVLSHNIFTRQTSLLVNQETPFFFLAAGAPPL